MPCLDEGGGEAATVERAAVIAGIDLRTVDALADEEHADLEIRHQHRAGLPADLDRVADVVVVPVSKKHMGRTLRNVLPCLFRAGIAGDERIEDDLLARRLDGEGRMAVPGQFHLDVPRL